MTVDRFPWFVLGHGWRRVELNAESCFAEDIVRLLVEPALRSLMDMDFVLDDVRFRIASFCALFRD
jgi:hypothetical protein